MIHTDKTTSRLFHITRPLLAALGIFSLLCQQAEAATNDNVFNQCVQIFDHLPNTQTTDHWHKTALEPKLARLEDPNLYGSVILKWISNKNQNGTTSFVIFTRDPGPQFGDDPDGFDVFVEKDGQFSEKAEVAVNGFAFSKESNQGVNDLLFCTLGELYKWKWDKNNWQFYSKGTSE